MNDVKKEESRRLLIEKIKEVQELPEEIVKEFLEAKGKLDE